MPTVNKLESCYLSCALDTQSDVHGLLPVWYTFHNLKWSGAEISWPVKCEDVCVDRSVLCSHD